MRRTTAVLLCAWLALPGCAVARSPRLAVAEQQSRSDSRAELVAQTDPTLMADYIRQLRVGSRVKVVRATGEVFRATLMKGDADPIVVQRRTRIPEPPITIPVSDIAALEIEKPESIGRAVAIGIATGVGATFGLLLLIAAAFSD
jgi:hypothetical protein